MRPFAKFIAVLVGLFPPFFMGAGLLYAYEPPSFSNAFLAVGLDAADEALGRAALALPFHPGLERRNPAALARLSARHAASFSFASTFSGMANLEYISYGYRLDSSSVLGASLLRFGVEGIQNTLAWRAPDGTEDYTRITRFGTSDYALHLAYARRFAVPGLTLGGHVKIIYRNVGPFANAFGVGFDIVVNYHRANWGVALALRDVTTTFNAWFVNVGRLQIAVVDSIFNVGTPRAVELTLPSAELAWGQRVPLPAEHYFLVGLTALVTTDGRPHVLLAGRALGLDPAVGFAWGWRNIFELRIGARQFQLLDAPNHKKSFTATPSAGRGVSAWGWRLDYAFSMPLLGESLLYNHLVTIACQFGR